MSVMSITHVKMVAHAQTLLATTSVGVHLDTVVIPAN